MAINFDEFQSEESTPSSVNFDEFQPIEQKKPISQVITENIKKLAPSMPQEEALKSPFAKYQGPPQTPKPTDILIQPQADPLWEAQQTVKAIAHGALTSPEAFTQQLPYAEGLGEQGKPLIPPVLGEITKRIYETAPARMLVEPVTPEPGMAGQVGEIIGQLGMGAVLSMIPTLARAMRMKPTEVMKQVVAESKATNTPVNEVVRAKIEQLGTPTEAEVMAGQAITPEMKPYSPALTGAYAKQAKMPEVKPAEITPTETFIHEGRQPITQFDLSKIGTGQGESWYGQGAYLTKKGGFKFETYGPVKSEFALPKDAKIFSGDIVSYAENKGLIDYLLEKRASQGLGKDNITPKDVFDSNWIATEKGFRNQVVDALQQEGYKGYRNGDELVMYDPTVLKPTQPTEPKSFRVTPEEVKPTESIKFETGGDALGDQYNGYIVAKNKDGELMGYVDYSYWHGKTKVMMIEVKPEFRRKGVGLALLNELQSQAEPGDVIGIQGDIATPEGQALWKRFKGKKPKAPTGEITPYREGMEEVKPPEPPPVEAKPTTPTRTDIYNQMQNRITALGREKGELDLKLQSVYKEKGIESPEAVALEDQLSNMEREYSRLLKQHNEFLAGKTPVEAKPTEPIPTKPARYYIEGTDYDTFIISDSTGKKIDEFVNQKQALAKYTELQKSLPPTQTEIRAELSKTPTNIPKGIPKSLEPLAKEAQKYSNPEEFAHDFSIGIKHGRYWHVTDNPNFNISPELGPRDMSSLASGMMDKGNLMLTSDLPQWAEHYQGTRKYAAEIDMSNVSPKDYYQVNRGFGNEFFVKNPAGAKVVKVVPIETALKEDAQYQRALEKHIGSKEDLINFYQKVNPKEISAGLPKGVTAEDFQLNPERMQGLKQNVVAFKVGDKVISAKIGSKINGQEVWNHADLGVAKGIDFDTATPGFLDKQGKFIEQYPKEISAGVKEAPTVEPTIPVKEVPFSIETSKPSTYSGVKTIEMGVLETTGEYKGVINKQPSYKLELWKGGGPNDWRVTRLEYTKDIDAFHTFDEFPEKTGLTLKEAKQYATDRLKEFHQPPTVQPEAPSVPKEGIAKRLITEEEQYQEVVSKVQSELAGQKLNPKQLRDYAKENNIPAGWVESAYAQANPPTVEQLQREIADLESRQSKLHKPVTSRAQATTREANLGKLQQIIDTKKAQLAEIQKPSIAKRLITEEKGGLTIGGRREELLGKLGEPIEIPEKAVNINLKNLDTPDDVKGLITQIGKLYEPEIQEARRGVITHQQTAKLADDLGMSVEDLLKRKKGEALNAEELLGARRLLTFSQEEALTKAQQFTRTNSNQDMADALESFFNAVAVQKQVSGAQTETARALNAMKMLAGPEVAREQAMKRIIAQMGGQEVTQEILTRLGSLDISNPLAVNRFLRDITKAKTSQKVLSVWINAMLSGLPTHIANDLSNLSSLLIRPFEAIGAATLDIPRAAFTGTPRQRFFGEAPADFIGMTQGLKEAAKVFVHSLATGEPGFIKSTKIDISPSFLAGKPIKGKVGTFVNVPTTLLQAEDDFFKVLNKRGAANAFAYREASKQGTGIKGMAKLLSDMPQWLDDASNEEAVYRTYQKELGKVGKGVMRFREDLGVPGKVAIPFVRTPINVAKFALERTPFNFPRIAIQAIKGDLSGGKISEDLARATIGTAIGYLTMHYTWEGRITGGGPREPNKRKAWMMTHQPYSFKVGNRWVGYGRLEPIASVIGMAADLAEIWDEVDLSDAAAKLMFSIGKNLTSKTFLTGISDIIHALDGPTAAEKWATRLGGTVVPGFVAKVTQTIDPTIRRPDNPLEGIEARLPFLSEKIPPLRDIWGRPVIMQETGPERFVSPIRRMEIPDDKATSEYVRLGLSASTPAKSFGKIDITSDAYQTYLEQSGEAAHKAVSKIVSRPFYARLNDMQRSELIKKVMENARKPYRARMKLETWRKFKAEGGTMKEFMAESRGYLPESLQRPGE